MLCLHEPLYNVIQPSTFILLSRFRRDCLLFMGAVLRNGIAKKAVHHSLIKEKKVRIKLKVQGVTDIIANRSASLLILTDEDEKRQMTIIVDEIMRHEFAIRRGKYVGTLEQRANAIDGLQHCLPETVSALLKYLTNVELCVVIVSIFDGQYRALIEDRRTGTAFPIRVSDGILLAYADPHVPLYVEESLWDAQSTPYMGENPKGISLPLNTLSVPMLKQILNKCIDDERYETAQQIKEELSRRRV